MSFLARIGVARVETIFASLVKALVAACVEIYVVEMIVTTRSSIIIFELTRVV